MNYKFTDDKVHHETVCDVHACHAKFIDVQQRTEYVVEDAIYFVDRQGFHIFLDFNILNTLSLILIMVTKSLISSLHMVLF